MGELYDPYPKLPKNIRQIGERDSVMRLYMEDYVNTYLKQLFPAGGQDLRAGLLLGETRTEDGMPYLFVDGALEIEDVTEPGEKVDITEADWRKAYKMMEQLFPRRVVLGWFLCGVPGCGLSPLNYWKTHSRYFAARNQILYCNSSLEGEEAFYTASGEGFYRLRGYSIYYERNQCMQDYMVSRKDARRVESGMRDVVTEDFRQRMESRRLEARRTSSLTGALGTACSVLAVLVLAGGVVLYNNYGRMKEMESVIASALPEGSGFSWDRLAVGEKEDEDHVEVEEIAGEVYPTQEIAVGGETEQGDEASLAAGLSGGEENTENTEIPDQAAGADAEIREVAVQTPVETYLVKTGETLYGICLDRYHSINRIEEICRLNQMEDPDHIMAGQEILLPVQ